MPDSAIVNVYSYSRDKNEQFDHLNNIDGPKEDEKYLGDIISTNGRNIKNIKARIGKGIGIMKNILNLLDGIPFGKFYFEVAIILRNCLFVSSVLFNSEVWYNLTIAELDLLETVDVDL